MSDPAPTSRRKYDSTRRKAQARETRRQIAAAARALFIERGYDGTTIDAVAAAAGVAPETIYVIFGSKRKILWHLVDIAIGGDDEDVRLMDRPDPRAVLSETNPARQIEMFSRGISEILSRTAPVMEILRGVAKNDEELAGLLERMLSERIRNMTRVAESILGNPGARQDLDTGTAADQVWALTSPEVYLLFTRDRGYSREQYADWLRATLARLLLE